MKRLEKWFKRNKGGSQSHESPPRPETPSPNDSVRNTSPRPGSSAAVSALVFHPFIPIPSTPHIEPGQAEITGAGNNSWKNLTAFLDLLNRTPAFSPLVAAIDDLGWFFRAYETTVPIRTEYDLLRAKLEALFEDLRGHFSGNAPPTMTSSMSSLCREIQIELEGIYGTKDRNTISRHLQAEQDLDKITACYRRIEGHLERVMRIVDEQATDAKLDRLKPSMPACYDSAEANLVQRRECAANTRKQVLLDLKTWKDKREGEKVCWINGMAGTGKTTITTTLCSILDSNHELGASFFCTRSLPSCREVKFILPTIAYQLARFSSPFRCALLQVLGSDPDVHTKVPRVQFRRMILEPLQTVIRSLPPSIVVVIDALDECEDNDGVREILEVLLERASELPIKILVSRRPEYHIRQKLSQSSQKAQLTLHELDKKMVKEDIETYLRAELSSIPMPPTHDPIGSLVERAGVLFIYAATVVRYIKDGDPLERLETVLQTPGPGQESATQTKLIDGLYDTVLESALNNPRLERSEKQRMELVLHTVVCAQEPLTVSALSGFLGLSSTRVMAALKPLWSVLQVSETDAACRISTLHSSFPDYMLDGGRSREFTCNAQAHNSKLAELCFQRISGNNRQFNICDLRSSCVLDKDVPDIDEKVKENIPSDLLYACQYWTVHLKLGIMSEDQVTQLEDFFSKRLLLWMEVLNLTKRIDKGVRQMDEALSWLRGTTHSESIMLLARDIR
ncbi:unnamed protein product, partial [Rhizoctonia solani]